MKKLFISTLFTLVPFLFFSQNSVESFDSETEILMDNLTNSTYPILRLAMTDNTDTLHTLVYFYAGATNGYDAMYDAFYLNGFTYFQFGTKVDSHKLSANALPPLNTSPVTVHLNTEIYMADSYSIFQTEFSNFPTGCQLILEDSMLSTTHDLHSGPYFFYGDTTDEHSRFKINIIPNSIVSDVYEDKNIFQIYKYREGLCISLAEPATCSQAIRIYNLMGQSIFSSTIQKGEQILNLANLNLLKDNIYIVELEGFEKSQKIIW